MERREESSLLSPRLGEEAPPRATRARPLTRVSIEPGPGPVCTIDACMCVCMCMQYYDFSVSLNSVFDNYP